VPAYVIIDSKVRDLEQYQRAQPHGMKALQEAGGHFIARAQEPLILEGAWAPSRLSIVEFPNIQQAEQWYASADYRAAKAIRQDAAEMSVIAIPGLQT
jgi:uncharacterized protein (DUF1330 family)